MAAIAIVFENLINLIRAKPLLAHTRLCYGTGAKLTDKGIAHIRHSGIAVQSPLLFHFRDYVFQNLLLLQIEPQSLKNFLISFHEKRELVFESIERRIAENSGKIRKWGSPYLLYTLIDTLVDRILYLTEEIEDAISDLEDETVRAADGDSDGEDIRTIYHLKRLVVRIGRMIYPLRDMVRTFERYDHPLLPPEMDMYFSDLYDHTLRAFDRIEHSRIILQELQDFYHSEHERRTSEIIRFLTVITFMFIPTTFITGFFGMNFTHIPGLESEAGVYVVGGLMALFFIGSVIFFRVKKWF